MLVDTHCHIHLLENYPDNLDDILKAADDNGVKAFLCVAISLNDMPDLKQIAEHDNVYISAGVHPNEAPKEPINIDALMREATHEKVIAIGETGLDYYRQEEGDDIRWQQERFIAHIDMARVLQKPLIIHTRNAKDDTIEMMRAHHADEACGIMHCFTEDWEMAKKALDLGFYISFSGIVTFKSATIIQEVAKKMPADRILLETDCPYLAPVPFRGKPNQPAYVKHTAEFMAELRGVSFETIAEQTTRNFHTLFKMNHQ